MQMRSWCLQELHVYPWIAKLIPETDWCAAKMCWRTYDYGQPVQTGRPAALNLDSTVERAAEQKGRFSVKSGSAGDNLEPTNGPLQTHFVNVGQRLWPSALLHSAWSFTVRLFAFAIWRYNFLTLVLANVLLQLLQSPYTIPNRLSY